MYIITEGGNSRGKFTIITEDGISQQKLPPPTPEVDNGFVMF